MKPAGGLFREKEIYSSFSLLHRCTRVTGAVCPNPGFPRAADDGMIRDKDFTPRWALALCGRPKSPARAQLRRHFASLARLYAIPPINDKGARIADGR
jgi:hypothetical protein